MQTDILISGQISGNFRLLRALNNGNYSKGNFNSFTIHFKTKGEAIKAIKAGYKSLKNEEPEYSGISKSNCNTFLRYDASNAEIKTN
jgi:hypothetical protein